ncbi:amino acid transporter [Aspergillus coremiiformis]|uniref:Amino acid transporter n=1 Tax=Aspergillus coremiiformis TaxID=138285 RepID=A0A5N6Z027_9EURO|nr:amino acid transporter [Aspergillus coremiiformis]
MQPSKAEKIVTTTAAGDVSGMDADTKRLAEMGYTQDMKRNFSVVSLLGVAFSLANSWFGISASLITGINSGGTVLTIYGIPWIALISTCVGITLSELASAMPNAGGQYFWASELSPKRYAPFASYLTGWLAWTGAIFTCASVALSLASATIGMWQLSHPAPLNPGTPTGWPSNTLAFLVGLTNPNWVFACLDSATHLAEEVLHPERTIPIAILSTVAIGFATSWPYCIAMFFSITSLSEIQNSPTGVPILALFNQALSNKNAALALESLILITGFGCQIACHTWQSRLCWSFARDRGLPFSRWLAIVHPTLDVPLNAHVASCAVVAVLGLLYLGSSTAFNSMVTACIVLLYVSYVVPIVALLYRGRERIRHGPFWLGRVGLVCNVVVLLWTGFCLVVYSFPSVYPVTPGNMNYICVVYAIVGVIIAVDWMVRGRKCFRGQDDRQREVEDVGGFLS